MKNILKNTLSLLLFGGNKNLEGQPLQSKADSRGVVFYTAEHTMAELKAGRGTSVAMLQTVVLQMLWEQGDAEDIPNGYRVSSEVIAALDEEQSELLGLPARVPFSFVANVSGHTQKAGFKVNLALVVDGQECPFTRKGPYLALGDNRIYRLRHHELLALQAQEKHQSLTPEQTGVTENLRLMAMLQTAERSGMKLDLGAYKRLDVVVPENIGVVATRLPDGSLELCPSLGDGSTPDQLDRRWAQLDLTKENGVLRVDNRLVLLEPEKMSAVKEVLGNKRIPAEKVEEFMRTPMAFLDASIVNLDMGFSLRVMGVGKLQHMEFDPADGKKTDWFGLESQALPPEVLSKYVTCPEDLAAFTEQLHAAREQGAETLNFRGETIDISDAVKVDNLVKSLAESFDTPKEKPADKNEPRESKEQVSLLLKDADERNQLLLQKVNHRETNIEFDRTNLLRMPFPHQAEGIQWMLGLLNQAAVETKNDMYRVQGALLADDMGLGKTYMTLVMMAEYLAKQKLSGSTQKPVLVVAPLSLLENWEQEIDKTFVNSPFRDVKVLQAGRDLRDFKIKGADRESVQLSAVLESKEVMDESDIRYALKIGADAGISRLDMDRRLVLTTYQTLRDYQFSLCVVDWGVVVFDEAQNVKNPNTLQTHAAKGLKADFKLLATGTPVENSLGDFWCLMDTAQPGLLGDWTEFRDRWIAPITQADEDSRNQIRAEIGASLRDAVGPFMLRRIKEDQLTGLPKKYIRSGLIHSNEDTFQPAPELAAVMNGRQLSAYDDILDHYREQSATSNMQGRALATLQLLRSISLHPRLAGNEPILVNGAKEARMVINESAKLSAVLSQLDAIQAKEEKVILFMVTKQLQRALKIWLDQIYGLNIHIINGDTAAVQKKKDVFTRKTMIEHFESLEGFNIIIMSPVAAGVGLTVVGANHVIHVERHWNPAKEAQASDRVYRIGQTKDVYIHLPAAIHPEFDSFDVNLDKLLRGKLMIKDAVVTPESVDESEMIKSMGL